MKIANPIPTPQAVLPKRNSILTYDRVKDTVQTSANTGLSSFGGYSLGALVGGIAHNAGAYKAYEQFAPATGAVVAGLWSLAVQTKSKTLENTALAASLGAVGAFGGDLLGRGLSSVSGLPVYQALGPAVGALNGVILSSLNISTSRFGDNTVPTAVGLSSGATLGCLAGALVSKVTGNPIYNVVAPILGAVAGGLTGAAFTVKLYEPKKTEADKQAA